MKIKLNELGDKIDIDDVASEQNISTEEMDPSERAKFTLAGWVLFVSVLLMIIAWYVKAYYPIRVLDLECPGNTVDFCTEQIEKAFSYSTAAAENIFELAKTWIPPVITLILGYYFGRGGDSNNNSK